MAYMNDIVNHPNRYTVCDDCGREAGAYMLSDELWYKVALKVEILCLSCVSSRLGIKPHELSPWDFKDAPVNRQIFLLKGWDPEYASEK